MKLYQCDSCGKITKKPMVIWESEDCQDKYFCCLECTKKWIDKQLEQVKLDREPYDFLQDESIGRTD